MGRHNVGFDSHFDTVLLRTPSGSTLTGIIGGERYRATLEHIEAKGPAPETESEFRERMKRQALWTEPERYPMGADQPAQVDCRRTDCQFYQGAGKCSNVAPAITLNPQKTYVCWSHQDKEPELKPCLQCGEKAEWESQSRSTATVSRPLVHRIVCSSKSCGRRTGWGYFVDAVLDDWNRGTP